MSSSKSRKGTVAIQLSSCSTSNALQILTQANLAATQHQPHQAFFKP
jgi:hypothetical protein